jgi:hypothetical protein
MTGEEIAFEQHPEGHWTATKDDLVGTGPSKEDAHTSLLEKIATKPIPHVVSDQTIHNKMELGQQMSAEVSRLMTKKLKNPTPEGATWVAYYSDKTDIQGYGDNESNAKLDLFKKVKEHKAKVQ